MLKLQADFGKKHELYTVKAISLREVFSEAYARANTIPKITQIYTAVHWSSCLICQMLIDTRIFICRVDPEHFSCESMFQSSLILKRQAVPEVKKKNHTKWKSYPLSEQRNPQAMEGTSPKLETFFANKYNSQNSYFLFICTEHTVQVCISDIWYLVSWPSLVPSSSSGQYWYSHRCHKSYLKNQCRQL